MNSKQLLEQAHHAKEKAFAPYSKFKVGAALLGKSGKVYLGCNVENASYGATICAERVAVVKAISEGEKEFSSIAIVSSSGDFTYPCGMCRQVMSEFGLNLNMIFSNGSEIKEGTVGEFLPNSFYLV